MFNRPTVFRMSLLLLALAPGCKSYRTETFDIIVTNETNKPLTISLAKVATAGPPEPYEAAWATPEDAAFESPRANEKWSMDVVPPGKTASVEKITGQFDARTHAAFRAYWGEMKISDMLARSRGSPDRVDVDLVPGRNDIRIIQRDGHISAVVDQPAPPPPR